MCTLYRFIRLFVDPLFIRSVNKPCDHQDSQRMCVYSLKQTSSAYSTHRSKVTRNYFLRMGMVVLMMALENAFACVCANDREREKP